MFESSQGNTVIDRLFKKVNNFLDESEALEKQPNHVLISLQTDLENLFFSRKHTAAKGGPDLIEEGNKKVNDEINRGLETRDKLVDINKDLSKTKDEASEMEANANDLKRLAGRHYKVVGYIFLVLSIIFAVVGIVYVIVTKMNKNIAHQQFFYKKYAYHDENIAQEADTKKPETYSRGSGPKERLLINDIHDQQGEFGNSILQNIKVTQQNNDKSTIALKPDCMLVKELQEGSLNSSTLQPVNRTDVDDSDLRDGLVQDHHRPIRLV